MRHVRAVLLVMLMAALTGCGLAGKAVEKATEKAVEKAVEKTTGVSVDQDKNSVTFKGQDGQQMTITSADGKLPDGFPIPVYKGGKALNWATINSDNKKGWTAEIQFDAEPKEIADYYEKLLKDRGGTVTRMDSNSNGEVSITLIVDSAKEGGFLTVSRYANDPTNMAVIWNEK